MRVILWTSTMIFIFAAQTLGQLTIPSNGSDGDFVISDHMTIDLSLAASLCDCDGIDQDGDGDFIDDDCKWDCPSPDPGKGVYDREQWAVVFNYSSITSTPSTADYNVYFANHPSGAPVVWLVDGDAYLGDTALYLGGAGGTGATALQSNGGPGGFRGGRTTLGTSPGSGGFGPGGGDYVSASTVGGGGSYGTMGTVDFAGPTYGNDAIIPLIGGSGGSGDPNYTSAGGGAGGGAILIAASGTITINRTIQANGGNSNGAEAGSGSGGAIRLIADNVTGTGTLGAPKGTGGYHGGYGRIRIEANKVSMGESTPAASIVAPGRPPLYDIWPPEDAPKMRVSQIDYTNAQSGREESIVLPDDWDPVSNLNFPNQDVTIDTDLNITMYVEGTNVPLAWIVTLRVVPKSGDTITIDATVPVESGGDDMFWIRKVDFAMPRGIAAIQLRAAQPER